MMVKKCGDGKKMVSVNEDMGICEGTEGRGEPERAAG